MNSSRVDSLRQANSRLAQGDYSLWGPLATDVARERLGWLDLPERSRALLPSLDALSAWARSAGINRIVLSGMGGSSLAPEVIASTYHRDLILLDSTHPDDVRAVLTPDPDHTIFVIASKSGETIETRSHLHAISARIESAGLVLRDHLVVISDPGSPLTNWAIEQELRHFVGETDVGGRFSALSIFGLLPAALLGIDCAMLLDDASDMRKRLLVASPENPAVALADQILAQQPFLTLPDRPLSDWIEQLVAESTGKSGVGIIPIITSDERVDPVTESAMSWPLGAAFYLWEWATALIGFALSVNPFDQPNVASAKAATAAVLAGDTRKVSALALTSQAALALVDHMPADDFGYIGLLAFVPMRDKAMRQTMHEIRQGLHDRFRLAEKEVTLGFGPRYLHSTGQCHKGGPPLGAFLLITLDSPSDYPIPGESYTFATLLKAQALGDYFTLVEIGRPVVHAHLTHDELRRFSQSLHVAS